MISLTLHISGPFFIAQLIFRSVGNFPVMTRLQRKKDPRHTCSLSKDDIDLNYYFKKIPTVPKTHMWPFLHTLWGGGQRLYKLTQMTMLLSSTPRNFLQNVISSIFSSSTRREFIDWRFSYVHSVMLVFSTQLCDLYSPLFPLSSSLWFNTTLPPFSVLAGSLKVFLEGSGVLNR